MRHRPTCVHGSSCHGDSLDSRGVAAASAVKQEQNEVPFPCIQGVSMNRLGVQGGSFYVCFTAEAAATPRLASILQRWVVRVTAQPERSARVDAVRIGPCRTLGRALIRPPALDIGQAATFSQREKDDRSRAHRGCPDSAGSDGSRVPGGACRSSREVVLDVHRSVGLVPSPAGRGRGLSRSGGWPRVRAWTCVASASARGGPLGVPSATPERPSRPAPGVLDLRFRA